MNRKWQEIEGDLYCVFNKMKAYFKLTKWGTVAYTYSEYNCTNVPHSWAQPLERFILEFAQDIHFIMDILNPFNILHNEINIAHNT